MVLRESLLALHSDVADLAAALADAETAYAATLWADSTYLQPAQPSTFGHYFGHFGEQPVRHLTRIEAAYRTADSCPGGAGGAGGTRIPIDRARLAELLGFAEIGYHTRDAMWSVDVLSDAVNAAAQAVLTVDEFAEDLEIFASPAFDYLELDASLCRASVLMPQKRNPYALAVLRGGAGTVIGRATGLLATAKSPSARTDNWLYAYGEVAGTLALAGRLVRLGSGRHPRDPAECRGSRQWCRRELHRCRRSRRGPVAGQRAGLPHVLQDRRTGGRGGDRRRSDPAQPQPPSPPSPARSPAVTVIIDPALIRASDQPDTLVERPHGPRLRRPGSGARARASGSVRSGATGGRLAVRAARRHRQCGTRIAGRRDKDRRQWAFGDQVNGQTSGMTSIATPSQTTMVTSPNFQ